MIYALCLEAIIDANLRTFRLTIWSSEHCAGVQKRQITGMRQRALLNICLFRQRALLLINRCALGAHCAVSQMQGNLKGASKLEIFLCNFLAQPKLQNSHIEIDQGGEMVCNCQHYFLCSQRCTRATSIIWFGGVGAVYLGEKVFMASLSLSLKSSLYLSKQQYSPKKSWIRVASIIIIWCCFDGKFVSEAFLGFSWRWVGF